MQKEYQLAVDIEKKILTPSFEVNTLDLKTIKLKITITKGMTLVDLTDITVRMSIRKPDGNVLFQDCQVVNAKGGQVEIILENQAYVLPGSYSAEIMCFKGTDKVAVTGSFSYRSIKGIMDDKAVESKSEFTAITKQLDDVQATVNDLRENGTGIDAQARQEAKRVSARLEEKANYEIDAPLDLLSNDVESFINSNSGKKIKFPFGKTFLVDKQIILNGLTNTLIDFNNCTFKLANGFNPTTRWTGSVGAGSVAIQVVNCKNIKIDNLILDGNKENNTDNIQCTGLEIHNTNGFECNKLLAHSFTSKMINILKGTKNILFKNTTMYSLGNGHGMAYVFVSNNPDDNFSFNHVTVENEAITTTGQIFYIAGYNGDISDIKAKNVQNVFDTRRGYHVIRNINVDTCVGVFTVQKYPAETKSAESEVIVENVKAINVSGDVTGTAGIYILDCKRFVLKNLYMEMTDSSTYNWYGIRIRKYDSSSHIDNVQIDNIQIKNAKTNAVFIQDITTQCVLKNVKGITDKYSDIQGSSVLGINNVKSYQIVENLQNEGYYSDLTNPARPFVAYTINNLLNAGTTDQRPGIANYRNQGFMYFDLSLKKPIWKYDTGWITTIGNFVNVPTASNSPGNKGDFSANSTYFFVCYNPNAWIRIPKDSVTW